MLAKIKNAKQLASAQKEINMHELGMTIAKKTVVTAIEKTLAILAYIHGDKKSFDADIESTIRKYADKRIFNNPDDKADKKLYMASRVRCSSDKKGVLTTKRGDAENRTRKTQTHKNAEQLINDSCKYGIDWRNLEYSKLKQKVQLAKKEADKVKEHKERLKSCSKTLDSFYNSKIIDEALSLVDQLDVELSRLLTKQSKATREFRKNLPEVKTA